MKKSRRQPRRRFPALELALLTALLAAGIYGVYQYVHAQSSVSIQASPSPHQVASASPSPSPSATPAKPATEFDIPELGIKMTLPSGLAGLTYSVKLNQPGNAEHPSPYSIASFTTNVLYSQGGSHCSASDAPIGGIARYSEDPSTFATGVGPVKKIAGFYVAFVGPQALCADAAHESDTVNRLQTSETDILKQAFESAKPL